MNLILRALGPLLRVSGGGANNCSISWEWPVDSLRHVDAEGRAPSPRLLGLELLYHALAIQPPILGINTVIPIGIGVIETLFSTGGLGKRSAVQSLDLCGNAYQSGVA